MKKDLTVCYFGTYRQHYSRNQIIMAGLEAAGVRVHQCHATLWHGVEDRVAGFNVAHLSGFAPLVGLSFVVLAVSVALFVRLKQRRLKVISLVASSVLTFGLFAFASSGVGFPAILALSLLLLMSLLAPVLLDRRLKHGSRPATT